MCLWAQMISPEGRNTKNQLFKLNGRTLFPRCNGYRCNRGSGTTRPEPPLDPNAKNDVTREKKKASTFLSMAFSKAKLLLIISALRL